MAPTPRDPAILPTPDDLLPDSLRGTPGFFRTGRARSGQWWLIDPEGRAFISKGVAGVNRWGRRDGRQPRPGPYAEAVAKREEGLYFWAEAEERLRSWFFNTLGPWAGGGAEDMGFARTEVLELGGCGPQIHAFGARLPDVFDPGWREAAQARAQERCAPWRGSRELIGYFSDDDPGWAQMRDGEAEARPALLQICLSLEPSQRAYHAAWEFVLATRRGDLATLARDWAVELPNKETLRQLTQREVALTSEGYRRDQRLFTREFARRYFGTCAAVVRTHDPEHLLLGCRFRGNPGAAVLTECVYPLVDVVSVSPVDDAWEKTAQACHAARGMPVLMTGVDWTGEAFLRAPVPRPPRPTTSVERMLKKGRAALERLCAQRAVVGYEWTAWADLEGEQPPFASGLVHLDNREAREHTELLAEVNARAEKLRLKPRR